MNYPLMCPLSKECVSQCDNALRMILCTYTNELSVNVVSYVFAQIPIPLISVFDASTASDNL
jgi:hypothetical protein